MNFSGASAPGAPDGLRPVFLRAPVPAGCTLIVVLSRHTCSLRRARICSCCNRAKTRSNTPAIHPRVDRVPVAKLFGQAAPFATMLHHIKQGVKQSQIGHAHIPTLPRQAIGDPLVLMLGKLHDRHIALNIQIVQVVLTGPRAFSIKL